METVSASEIVRQFGRWQDRALAEPVYIRHHGRAKLVLTSLDFVERLVADRSREGFDRRSIAALLDVIETAVLVADGGDQIIGMSAGARAAFACPDWRGKTLADVLPDHFRAIVLRSAADVASTGRADSFQLRAGPKADRRLDVTIKPFGEGVCIVAQDRGGHDDHRDSIALSGAVEETMQQLGTLAVARLNLRGFITRASDSFEAMSGLAPDAYRSVRLPTLFDVGTRMGVSEALEATIDRLTPQVASARLVVNGGAPRDVRVAFSAQMMRSSIDAVVMTIQTVS